MKNLFVLSLFLILLPPLISNGATVQSNIAFADENVKAVCVQNWDTDGDGELSTDEAAAVTSIGSVFKSNSEITSFDEFQYFTGLSTTGDSVFQSCTKLTSVIIPNTINTIGNSAFRGCNSLMNMAIPNSVTSIGDFSFRYCTSLTNINIPDAVTSIGQSAFYNCIGLTSINIPNAVTVIGQSAFAYCKGLTNVNIPHAVTSIGSYAFSWCDGLSSVTIGHSVEIIGNCAFNSCSSLVNVTCLASNPPALGGPYALPDLVTSQATLHVPIGTKNAYQAADYWKNFSVIEETVVLATSIGLDIASAEMTEGETLQLTATILPEESTFKTIAWSSSDSNVASVDENGLVTALSAGSATITATTTDGSGLGMSCTITVNENIIIHGNYFTMNDTTVQSGETIIIPVSLTNEDNITAFQTDIYLPNGFEIVEEDGVFAIELSSRKTKKHLIVSNETDNGAIRVLCYAPDGKPFTGNNGELFYITVKVPEHADGIYNTWLKNSFLTKTDEEEISIDDTACSITVYSIIPGDANNSGTVTVTDIVVTAKYILNYNPQPFVFAAADVNSDGSITVTDIVIIARLVMNENLDAPMLTERPAAPSNDHMSGEDITLTLGETRTVSISLDNEMDYSAFQFDLQLPEGLTANNFTLTDPYGNHVLDVNTIESGKMRALCYSPTINAIDGNNGTLLTFDVTATGIVNGDILIDNIEMVTTACQTVMIDAFTIGVNSQTSLDDLSADKTVSSIEYFNLAGQRLTKPATGINLVVITYTDGTRAATKLIQNK